MLRLCVTSVLLVALSGCSATKTAASQSSAEERRSVIDSTARHTRTRSAWLHSVSILDADSIAVATPRGEIRIYRPHVNAQSSEIRASADTISTFSRSSATAETNVRSESSVRTRPGYRPGLLAAAAVALLIAIAAIRSRLLR